VAACPGKETVIVSSMMLWSFYLSVCALSYAAQAGALLIVGCLPWQKEVLCAELARHDLDVLLPADISAEVRRVQCGDARCTRECSHFQARHVVHECTEDSSCTPRAPHKQTSSLHESLQCRILHGCQGTVNRGVRYHGVLSTM
jgi:hypothetical protein